MRRGWGGGGRRGVNKLGGLPGVEGQVSTCQGEEGSGQDLTLEKGMKNGAGYGPLTHWDMDDPSEPK